MCTAAPEPERRRGRPSLLHRADVLAAAVKLLRDDGPSGLTARAVADALGVSRQVVYTQFGSLGGLVDALYREGFEQLRAGAETIDKHLTGPERLIEHTFGYRRFALANPELYRVMFERPFRDYSPPRESRVIALTAFETLVDAAASTGRDAAASRDLALTLWGAMHGLVHLELQGYFAFENSSERRLLDIVKGLL